MAAVIPVSTSPGLILIPRVRLASQHDRDHIYMMFSYKKGKHSCNRWPGSKQRFKRMKNGAKILLSRLPEDLRSNPTHGNCAGKIAAVFVS